MVMETLEIYWASLTGKKIQDTKDRWKAEEKGADAIIKCSLQPFVLLSYLFPESLCFVHTLLSYLLFEFAFLVGEWKNTNLTVPACFQHAEEHSWGKASVWRLLYSQLLNTTSYHVVERSSLLGFFLSSECVLQTHVFHAVIPNLLLLWMVAAIYPYWNGEWGWWSMYHNSPVSEKQQNWILGLFHC